MLKEEHSKWQKCTFHCIASSESKLVKSLLYSAPHNSAAAELTSGWRRQRYEPPSNLTSWNCFCDSTLFGEIKEYEAWMTLKPWQMSLDAKSAKLQLPRPTKTKTKYFESKQFIWSSAQKHWPRFLVRWRTLKIVYVITESAFGLLFIPETLLPPAWVLSK